MFKRGEKLVGVLGGMGPAATITFCQLLIDMTDAARDQDHVKTLVYNHGAIPDRTSYILGESDEDPVPYLTDDAHFLAHVGCDFLVIPCNTAHYYFDDISQAAGIPVINMLEETTARCAANGAKRVGVMGTRGTRKVGTYAKALEAAGMQCVYPNEENQSIVDWIIYSQVKAGRDVPEEKMLESIDHLTHDQGCDAVIFACTELSVVNQQLSLTKRFDHVVDSLECLAHEAIVRAGKRPKPFA